MLAEHTGLRLQGAEATGGEGLVEARLTDSQMLNLDESGSHATHIISAPKCGGECVCSACILLQLVCVYVCVCVCVCLEG